MRKLSPIIIVLMLMLVLATVLRFHALDAQSFWNDEGNSARIAERSIGLIIEGAGGDIHPPGYYLMLAGWRGLTGHSEFALRLFSALAGVLTVAVMAVLGTALFDRRVGILAALLVAISPFQVYYGQEARMYALLALLSAVSIYLTAKVLTLPGEMIAGRFNRRRALAIIGGYILTNTVGLYTHYSFPFIIAAETLIFAIWLARRVITRGRGSAGRTFMHGLRVWAMLQGVTLILFLPWLPHAIRQITIWPDTGAVGVGVLRLLSTVAYGITLPPDAARSSLIPLGLLAGIGFFPSVNEDRYYLRFIERIGLVAAWLAVPILLMTLAGALSESFLKFLLPANLALMLLAARGISVGFDLTKPLPIGSRLNALLTRLMVLIIALFSLWPLLASLSNLYTNPAYTKDNYRAIAERIRAEAGEDAVVILDAPNQWEVFTYYYPDGPNIAPLPDAQTEQTLARLIDDHRQIYVLYWGEAQQDPEGIVRRTLLESAFEASAEWYGGVQLVTYAVTGGPADTMQTPSGGQFGDTITLEGFTLSADQATPGEAIGVTLFWQADSLIGARLKVFVHLYAADGSLIAQHDSEPGGNLKPTDSWQAGETITDAHGLLIPPGTPPGIYRLAVGLYGMLDGVRLPVTLNGDSMGDTLTLIEITIE